MKHFTGICGHVVPESTVRKFRDAYHADLKAQSSANSGPVSVLSLPCKPKGRPLLLGNLDNVVKQYILQLRAVGGVINVDVVMAAARGIVESKSRSMLVEYGGKIAIERSWSKFLLTRLNFVKCKGSTAAKIPTSEFDNLKQSYLERIKEAAFGNGIVSQMVINMDQTAINLVPSSSWTMDEWEKNNIVIKGIEDKRQITALLAVTLSGMLLPPQLLYEGKTDRCHPHVNFPISDNHWSNTTTVLRFIDKVLNPYLQSKRVELGLPPTQKALLILDVFRAHCTTAVQQKLSESNILVVFVPANCIATPGFKCEQAL